MIKSILTAFSLVVFGQASLMQQLPNDAPAKIETAQDWTSCKGVLAEMAGSDARTLQNYASFVGSVEKAKLSPADQSRVRDALLFAAEKHREQKRKGANHEPYISHPIGVADQLMKIAHVKDADILIAALLHDTVEDTKTTFEEIKKRFGAVVEGYVREVTDDKSLPKAERKELQILNASHKSPGAALIKLSDKLYNLKDLSDAPPPEWDQKRIDAYFSWAKQVVVHLPDVDAGLKRALDKLFIAHEEKRLKN